MSSYWFIRNIVFPLNDMLFRQDISNRLAFLEAAQWWERTRIEEYQNCKLVELMNIVHTEVPFYRELMDSVGVGPNDIKSPGDLVKLPVVTKEMLRAAYPTQTVRKTGYRQFEGGSSGSTGANFIVMKDNYTVGLNQATVLLTFSWSGWRMGEPHMQMGITPKRGHQKKIKDTLLRCYYESAYDLTIAHIDACLEILDRHKVRHLMGFAGALYLIGKRAASVGWNIPLKSIISWGDNMFPHYRKTLESAFGVRVTDTYGCGEGIQVAAQCGVDSTYHIHDTDTIVEFLNDRGEPATSDEIAHIVLTRLHPGPMPLIRYRVGDIGIKGEGKPCSCGRNLSTMNSIQGRDTDIVITPSGNRLIVHFFTGILEHYYQIRLFQILQNQVDRITLMIVPAKDFDDRIQQAIIEDLKAHGAEDLHIDVELVDDIPLTASSKRRFVISKLERI